MLVTRQSALAAAHSLRSRQSHLTLRMASTSASTKSAPSTMSVVPAEPTLEPPAFYRSNPAPHHPKSSGDSTGVFCNPWESAGKNHGGLLDFFRTRLFDWEQSPWPKQEDMPKAAPCSWKAPAGSVDGKIICTWIGHAGCHFQIPVPGSKDRITVLTDPVLSHRCSPVQFMGPARLQKPPTSVADMAASTEPHVWPNVLVISHNHYDHLDYNTVKAILARPNGRPVPHIFCPLGVASFFQSLGVESDGITELDWWGQRTITFSAGENGRRALKLTCVPAQHFSGRSTRDRNHTLWAGWTMEAVASDASISAKGHKIYFVGDTGYRKVDREMVKAGKDHDLSIGLPGCPAFKEIGELLGPFDLSMIPIGAYKPRAFMSQIHVDPVEAIHIHKDARSKRSVAIHWGVFPLAADGPNEPPELLQEALKAANLTSDDFGCMSIGETRAF